MESHTDWIMGFPCQPPRPVGRHLKNYEGSTTQEQCLAWSCSGRGDSTVSAPSQSIIGRSRRQKGDRKKHSFLTAQAPFPPDDHPMEGAVPARTCLLAKAAAYLGAIRFQPRERLLSPPLIALWPGLQLPHSAAISAAASESGAGHRSHRLCCVQGRGHSH